MIINKDFYTCKKCHETYSFETSKEYSKMCPICNIEMEFFCNTNCDTELAEKVKNQTPIVPSSKPTVTCPYCQSTTVSKITVTKKAMKIGLFGIFGVIDDAGKTYKCDSCGCKF